MLPSMGPVLSWLQRCLLGWWPWWAQVYFRLCFLAQWRGHYLVQQEAHPCYILHYGGGICCWFHGCLGGCLVEKIPSRVWHCRTCSKPLSIYCDSSAAIAYSKDPKYHEKTKYIDIRYHFVCHMIVRKEVILRHISISCMVADLD